MERCIHRIFDIKEIASLLAVAVIRMCALKKPDSSGFSNLAERFMHDAAHLTLMGLIGAEDVEILQANDTIHPAVTFCVNIKKMLRVAIHVQRP